MTQFFQVLASGADSFMNLFRAGGQQFVGFVTDIVPLFSSIISYNECNYQLYWYR